MSTDTNITSDHPLTEPQRGILNALLNSIIPPDAERGMPGAGTIGLLAPGGETELIEAAAAILPAVTEIAGGLPAAVTPAILDRIASAQPALFQQLVMQTLICYYRNDEALRGLGLEPGPPFPRGNTIDPGDLSLLDPVRSRGKLYRE